MENKPPKPEILEAVDKEFQEIFDLFVESRLRMDRAAFLLRKTRMLLSTRAAYDAIIDQPDGDTYIKTERLLAEIEEGTMLWRSYMLEIEKEQLKKATKNPIIDFNLGLKYH